MLFLIVPCVLQRTVTVIPQAVVIYQEVLGDISSRYRGGVVALCYGIGDISFNPVEWPLLGGG